MTRRSEAGPAAQAGRAAGGAMPPAEGPRRATPPGTMRATSPLLYGLGAVLCWASLAAAVGRSVATLPPPRMLCGGLLVAGLALSALHVARRGLTLPAWPGWRVLLLGVYGIWGYHTLLVVAFALAPPAEANALNYTWPLWIVVLSGALPGHRLTGRVVLAGLLGFAGVLVVLTGPALAPAPGGAASARAFGLALALGAGFCWGSFTVLLRRLATPEQENMALFCLCGAGLAGLHGLATGVPLVPTAGELPVLLYIGLVPLALAFVLWERAVARAHLHRLGLLSFITPPLSMALLALATGVPLPWRVLAGLALILLGLALGRRGAGPAAAGNAAIP